MGSARGAVSRGPREDANFFSSREQWEGGRDCCACRSPAAASGRAGCRRGALDLLAEQAELLAVGLGAAELLNGLVEGVGGRLEVVLVLLGGVQRRLDVLQNLLVLVLDLGVHFGLVRLLQHPRLHGLERRGDGLLVSPNVRQVHVGVGVHLLLDPRQMLVVLPHELLALDLGLALQLVAVVPQHLALHLEHVTVRRGLVSKLLEHCGQHHLQVRLVLHRLALFTEE